MLAGLVCWMAMTSAPPDSVPPLSPYGTLHGSVFQYSRNLVAFESDNSTPNKCVLIGGLSDGLLPTPYAAGLDQTCRETGWTLVQPILSSSYLGFGNGDLERDTKELSELLKYLKHHRSAERIVLVGHSTGCQDSVHFTKHGDADMIGMVKAVVLQAPVSDREDAMREPSYDKNIATARSLVGDGKGLEMMPRSAFWAPITAKRFLDLQEFDGTDDFFSSDLTDDRLGEKLGHMGSNLPCVLVAFSGADEYVPEDIDSRSLTDRLCKAMNVHCKEGDKQVAEALYLDTANHNLSVGDVATFLEKVGEILERSKNL